MERANHSALSAFLSSRKENLRLAFVGILAALAIGILSGAILSMLESEVKWLAAITSIIILSIIAYIFRDLSSRMEFKDRIRAMIFFDGDGDIIKVDKYDFSEDFSQTLSAVHAENKAIHADWERHPLVEKTKGRENVGRRPSAKSDNPKSEKVTWASVVKVSRRESENEEVRPSIKLLEEIILFNIMEELSLHLSGHFNESEDDEKLVELTRADIPDFLLRNRILNLLSTPIEQREIFLEAFPDPKNRPEGEIYSIFGSNGAMYKRFDLILPKKHKLAPFGESGFTVSTDRFVLNVEVRYGGYSSPLPSGFAQLYLENEPRAISNKSVEIILSGRIFLRSIFTTRGWEFHDWLDSFRDRMIRDYDIQEFYRKIHWPVVSSIYRVGIPIMNKFGRKIEGS